MTGRDALCDGRANSGPPVPGGSPAGPRPRGFAITDLLGLEAELPAPAGPGPGSGCGGPAAAARRGPGRGASCLARGTLPLGLGLLCGCGAQPPACRAPRLLLADVPFLPPGGPEPAAPRVPARPPSPLGSRGSSESVAASGNQSPAAPAPARAPVPGIPGPRQPGPQTVAPSWEASAGARAPAPCFSPNPRPSSGVCARTPPPRGPGPCLRPRPPAAVSRGAVPAPGASLVLRARSRRKAWARLVRQREPGAPSGCQELAG